MTLVGKSFRHAPEFADAAAVRVTQPVACP